MNLKKEMKTFSKNIFFSKNYEGKYSQINFSSSVSMKKFNLISENSILLYEIVNTNNFIRT